MLLKATKRTGRQEEGYDDHPLISRYAYSADMIFLPSSMENPMSPSNRLSQGAGERAGEDGFPEIDRAFVMDTGVDYAPAVAILDQIDVHVIKPVRQWKTQPPDARRDLGHLARSRRL
ncbi:hypothetical protein [Hoeflea sp.]|uniref:hypothetical protein n=1 Tax=Hoeflea sp. TaxID=1940281 RepID=UPI0019C88D44|nr:hypothetical protein [Hoeflea sp.]MBC7280554.1 hypothetical protein [Hoeflea sp.]